MRGLEDKSKMDIVSVPGAGSGASLAVGANLDPPQGTKNVKHNSSRLSWVGPLVSCILICFTSCLCVQLRAVQPNIIPF